MWLFLYRASYALISTEGKSGYIPGACSAKERHVREIRQKLFACNTSGRTLMKPAAAYCGNLAAIFDQAGCDIAVMAIIC